MRLKRILIQPAQPAQETSMTKTKQRSAEKKLKSMLFWDVNNGIARRSWARNEGAIFAIKREMEKESGLKVTIPYIADDKMIENIILK